MHNPEEKTVAYRLYFAALVSGKGYVSNDILDAISTKAERMVLMEKAYFAKEKKRAQEQIDKEFEEQKERIQRMINTEQ